MGSSQGARHSVMSVLGLCVAGMLSGCGNRAESDSAPQTSGAMQTSGMDQEDSRFLPDGALDATWQELGVPGAGNRPALASTPVGFLALSRRSLGDSRAPSSWESHLYRSADGVRWDRVEVSAANDNLWLRGVAYGRGHYVLAGKRFGGGDDVIFHSTDGEQWDEIEIATGAPGGLSNVVFTGSRFFALSTFRTILTSTDGTTWTSVGLRSTVMPLDVTFGNDQYLLVGSGDLQRSTDGLQWLPTQLDCAQPGACITDPDGNVLQGVHYRSVFAAGSFFIDESTSTDGQEWRAQPGLHPQASVDGHVLGRSATSDLAIWRPNESARPLESMRYLETLSDGERPSRMLWNGSVEPDEYDIENFPSDQPLPDVLEFAVPGGDSCALAACFVVGNRLYLVSTTPAVD